MTFYDSTGTPVAYCDDGEKIWLFDGTPAGYLKGSLVYSYGGTLLGRFDSGWVRDNDGCCALFTESASGGPAKPAKRYMPVKQAKRNTPLKRNTYIVPNRKIDRSAWSDLSGEEFFEQ